MSQQTITQYMHSLGKTARTASRAMARASTATKNLALRHMADLIELQADALKTENAKDLAQARAKGLDEKTILTRHVLRNAMIPLITGFPAAFIGAFFTGSLLIETLFSLDGLGLLSYEAVMKRDYPVVMGTLYVFTLMSLVAKLLSDISYSWVDPRIHFGGQK